MTKPQIQQLRSGLNTLLGTLSLGERAFVEPLLDKVLGCISRGEIADARETIATYPAPTPTLAAARDTALAFFPK